MKNLFVMFILAFGIIFSLSSCSEEEFTLEEMEKEILLPTKVNLDYPVSSTTIDENPNEEGVENL